MIVRTGQSIDIVTANMPDLRDPLPPSSEDTEGERFFVIVETGGAEAAHDNAKLEAFLAAVMESGDVHDGVVAQDQRQAASFWAIRDNVEE